MSHVGIDASNSFEKCWQIMQEIQKNGPVVASMNVYIDFLIYKAGLRPLLNFSQVAHFAHAPCSLFFRRLQQISGEPEVLGQAFRKNHWMGHGARSTVLAHSELVGNAAR